MIRNNKANQKTWFTAESIPKVSHLLLVLISQKYGNYISKLGGSNYFHKILWIYKNGIAELLYLTHDFENGISHIFKKTIDNPSWFSNLNQKTFKENKKLFKYTQKLEYQDFSKLTDEKLASELSNLLKLIQVSHNTGQISTWLIDAERQLFSNHLLSLLKNKINAAKIKINQSKIFSILTTPEKPSLVEIESQQSLQIAQLIKQDKFACKLFLEKNINVIGDNLTNIKPVLRKKILDHYKKWLWIYYNYQGPVLELEYFLEVWKGLLQENNLGKLLKESQKKSIKIIKQRTGLFKKLKLTRKEKRLFDIAKDIVWTKSYRKDCNYFSSYITDKILVEIAKRIGISLEQSRFFCPWEIKDALLKRKFDANELDKRHQKSIIYIQSKGKTLVLTGSKAEKFIDKQGFKKQKIEMIDQIQGNCASPGKAKGKVCIVETVDDIPKMKDGDILLSETTYPALVPAMRKAAAIVTNVGGLTCHAAIVSRELKIPCVVGTKIATQVLQDGDYIEVNANRGIVKKVKDAPK